MFFEEAKWCFLKQNVHICCPSYCSFNKVPHGANPIKVFFSLTHIYQKNAIKLAHCKIKFFFVCYKCSILTARIEKRVKNKIGGIGSWFSYFAFQYLGRVIWLRIKKSWILQIDCTFQGRRQPNKFGKTFKLTYSTNPLLIATSSD